MLRLGLEFYITFPRFTVVRPRIAMHSMSYKYFTSKHSQTQYLQGEWRDTAVLCIAIGVVYGIVFLPILRWFEYFNQYLMYYISINGV